jgi:4-amino-4-deoxy-L-arabinose transferase-like glycosyltransferase
MTDMSKKKNCPGGFCLRGWAVELAGGRGRLTLIIGMLLLALAVRSYRLWEPPMDFHPTRQYIGAAVARSYYFNMDSSIPEWRRNIAQIGKDRQELLEPQIMPSLAAVSYRVVGGEHLWIPRFYSVVAWLTCGIVLLQIGRKLGLSPPERLWTLGIHLFLPFSVLNSRVFQPDPLMVLLMFLTMFCSLGYDRDPGWKRLLGVSAMAAATLFVKPVCVFMLFAVFAALMLARQGWKRTATHPHLYVFTALMLAPAVTFYVFQFTSGGFIGEQTEGSFIPGLLVQPSYWIGWLKMIGRNIGIQGLAAALIGIALVSNLRGRWFLGGLWFGYFCYGLFFNYHIHTHDYYSMMTIPMAALCVGPLAVRLTGFMLREWRERRVRLLCVAAAMCVVMGVAALGVLKLASAGKLTSTMKGRIKAVGSVFGADMKLLLFLGRGIDERGEARRYEEIGTLVEHSDKTLYLTHDHGKSLTYHGELAGANWPGQTEFKKWSLLEKGSMDGAALLKQRVEEDAMAFFVATELDELRKQPEIAAALEMDHSLVASNEFYRVYELKKPAR